MLAIDLSRQISILRKALACTFSESVSIRKCKNFYFDSTYDNISQDEDLKIFALTMMMRFRVIDFCGEADILGKALNKVSYNHIKRACNFF